jgi:protein-tyrosine-phosphatase
MIVRRLAAAVIMAAGLGLVACDDDNQAADDESNGGGPLTKEEFVQRADAICEEIEHRIQALEPPANTNDLDDYANAIAEVSDEGITELRSLKPPPGDATPIKDLIGNIERSIALFSDLARATQSQDGRLLRQTEAELQEIADESLLLAREYGFKQCGGDEGAPVE